MIMFVLDSPALLDAILDAWRGIGVSGVTIIESSGLYRQAQQRPVGARYAFGMPRAAKRVEAGNVTLFTIVPDEAAVRACLDAAEAITGDLNGRNTGVLAAWELGTVKGVPPVLAQPGDSESAGEP
jgi:hypothetical protein